MLASSVKRRLMGAICVAALVYSLIAMLVTNANQPAAEAIDMRGGAMVSAVDVLLTSTAASTYEAVPGSSPALKIMTTNRATKNCIDIGASYAADKACLQNANIGHGDATFTIEPGYSPDTDFQILSGTQLPTGFRFPGRAGRPGNSGSNPVNITGGHDSGTATAYVCFDGVFIGGFGNTCKWAREARSGDTLSGAGPGSVNCPTNWNTTAETSAGWYQPGDGLPHIVMVTNDAGPVNRSWGPVPPGGYADPKGQLWDVRRQRYAYARWTVVGCAGLTVGTLGGNQGFMIFQSLFLYKDEPVPGAYTISMMGTDDARLGSSGTNYKTCGGLLSTPPNPCNAIMELSLASDMYGSSKRIARTQNVCGGYGAQAASTDGVTSPGHTVVRNTKQLYSSGYPSCPTGVRGVVATSGTDATVADVYAFDSATGAIVNSTGGTGSAAAGVACMGGNLPYDGSAVPAGPGPGSQTPSYGCSRTVGNPGNYPYISPGFGDGRYYIRTNTGGPSYKLLVSPPQGSPYVPRWVGTVAPNGWADASTYSPSVGATPLQTGDGAFAGALTNTVASGTTVSGSVTRGGSWTTGTDQGDVVIYNSTGTTLDATATALTGNGSYNRAVSPASIKLRFSVADGVGNPPLVGWYSSTGTPADNFSSGTAVSPGALVTNNFTSGSTISGSLGAAAAGSSVYTYRNSDGQNVGAVSADSSGNWSVRVATAASAYKVYAVAPVAASLQAKWYNLKDSWGTADLVSAPQAAVNMTLPAASALQGYVKDASTAADIAGAPVYAYNSGTGAFAGWTSTGSTGRYNLGVAAASYKVLTGADSTHENQWWGGGWSYGEATSVAAPGTANFSVRAAGNVSGTSSTLGTPTAGYTIDAWNSTGTKSAGSTVSGAGGAYSMKLGTTAATGWQYRLRFTPPSGTPSSVRWYLDQTGFAGATNVTSPSSGINQDTPA